MKGVVFTVFQEMIEDNFGLEMYDRLIQSCDLPSDAAYTAVGTYDHTELMQLVGRLSMETGTPVPELVKAFGKHLFGALATAYPQFAEEVDNSIDFLASIEDYIHVEVKKLYPDAELPTFEFEQTGEQQWELRYFSTRPFADLCEGLVLASIEHFGDPVDVLREDDVDQPGTRARFLLTSRERVPA